MTCNAFSNAYCNANRKKNTRAIPLWKKISNVEINVLQLKQDFKDVLEYERNNSNDWIKKIYGERG